MIRNGGWWREDIWKTWSVPDYSTMIFITHQIPKGLQVDEVFSFDGPPQAGKVEMVGEQNE